MAVPTAARLALLAAAFAAMSVYMVVHLDPDAASSRSRFTTSQRPTAMFTCNGTDAAAAADMVYWKSLPDDAAYVSPLLQAQQQQYLTFEYIAGGWNNVRMAVECVLVLAHATGRTLVLPPRQKLYLLDENDGALGIQDFLDMPTLLASRGLRLIDADEFEQQHLRLAASSSSSSSSSLPWGRRMLAAADANLSWTNAFVVLPGDTAADEGDKDKKRRKQFAGGRPAVLYDARLQQARHLHLPASVDGRIALRQHPYAFAYFPDQQLQSYYRRFVRDYVRLNDAIQCAGARIVAALRRESGSSAGEFYALHVRRGEFGVEEVKLSAEEMLRNLRFPNGTPIVPPGATVYIATDDPHGVCENCRAERKLCAEFYRRNVTVPLGCPADPSWAAFERFGWRIRFLHDFVAAGLLGGVAPSRHGMVEAVVCARALAFAGTLYSTFTGFIHRLRGYHSVATGEATYYHSTGEVFRLQRPGFFWHAYWREWRAGWTDDAGNGI